MFELIICFWLSGLSLYTFLLRKQYVKSKEQIKYLLPFVQDKTLKALTSYIDDDKSELVFDENGDLIEKNLEAESGSLYNEAFSPLPDNCKCNSIEEAVDRRIPHRIAKYRFSIKRNQLKTKPSEVCLFWKPGTIFVQLYKKNDAQFFIILKNNNPLFLYSSIDSDREGKFARNSFENFSNFDIELLALPEEYLTKS